MAVYEPLPKEALEVVGCGHTGELSPGSPLPRTSTTDRDALRVSDALLTKPRCSQCGHGGTAVAADCPECRPGSSKVSRKRKD